VVRSPGAAPRSIDSMKYAGAPVDSPDAQPSLRSRRELIVLGVAGILTFLVLREARRKAKRDRVSRPTIDSRFAAFAPLARGERRIDFVSLGHALGDDMMMAVELQYALAPVMLVRDTGAGRLVAAWADRPERLASYVATHGVRVLATTPDGYALMERPVR